MASLSGKSLIGSQEASGTSDAFFAIDPVTGLNLQPAFVSASTEDVERAVSLAAEAFHTFSRITGVERAAFLRTSAKNIEVISTEVIARAAQETALPQPRLQGEIGRTCGQLRLFADLAEEGSWVQARIDPADPDRKPLPKPDVRSMLRPLGPIVVFGASNFPLAFSVAGGDTASALAAGNPVVVKAHPAHPGTSELVGHAIQQSVRECSLPKGTFSLLFDSGIRVAAELVRHPLIKGGGFTGSRKAGRALVDVASSRPEPIPFYAEMGSTNPLFILPGALRDRGDSLAAGLHNSFTMGAGQFCTKPGIVLVPEMPEANLFREKLATFVSAQDPFHLLTKSIQSSFQSATKERRSQPAVGLVAEGAASSANGLCAQAILFETTAETFLGTNLDEEIFGPTTLLVRHSTKEQLLAVARGLEGHLTATIHGTAEDLAEYTDLIAILEQKVGRLIFNGFPTGVEVTHAMVHGGPYPATSDGRSTSVGTQAILRFARPVCYQGFPDQTLPDELKNSNPLGIWRMINGEMTQKTVSI